MFGLNSSSLADGPQRSLKGKSGQFRNTRKDQATFSNHLKGVSEKTLMRSSELIPLSIDSLGSSRWWRVPHVPAHERVSYHIGSLNGCAGSRLRSRGSHYPRGTECSVICGKSPKVAPSFSGVLSQWAYSARCMHTRSFAHLCSSHTAREGAGKLGFLQEVRCGCP